MKTKKDYNFFGVFFFLQKSQHAGIKILGQLFLCCEFLVSFPDLIVTKLHVLLAMRFYTRSRGDATVPSRLEKSSRVYLHRRSRERLEIFWRFRFFDRKHSMQE